MDNKGKYLIILESLKFHIKEDLKKESTKNGVSSERLRLEYNLKSLKKYLKQSLPVFYFSLIKTLKLPELETDINFDEIDDKLELQYAIYLFHVLIEIVRNTDFGSDAKEDLLSVRHINLCLECLQDLSVYALRCHLHIKFRKTEVFSTNYIDDVPCRYSLLYMSVVFFEEMFKIKQFNLGNAMELVLRDYMAAIFSLFLVFHQSEWEPGSWLHEASQLLQPKLNHIWSGSWKMYYFRNLLLFKGLAKWPKSLRDQLHRELILRLMSEQGFTTLVATLLTSQHHMENTSYEDMSGTKIFTVVANIVSNSTHSIRFHFSMIEQIFTFCEICVNNVTMMASMGAGLLSLRKLYDLKEENAGFIKTKISNLLKPLSEPEDILSGLILMENEQFCSLISLLYHLFCTSSIECIPSEILIEYLPLLLQVYYNTPKEFKSKHQLGSLLMRCLHNRSSEELIEVIDCLYTLKFPDEWKILHNRILITPNVMHTELILKIAPLDFKEEFSISLALPELLMNEQFHNLTYRIFMILLDLMCNQLLLSETANVTHAEKSIDLLQTEEEFINFLNKNFPVKVDLILSLNTLISHQSLKTQITEHANEFLNFLKKLIKNRFENCPSENIESSDQVLVILLTIMQEMLEHTQLPETYKDIVPQLMKLKKRSHNQLVRQQSEKIILMLQNNYKSTDAESTIGFNYARSLIECKESHLQVYGIQLLIDLLRKRDKLTLSNGHINVALALTTLKEKESYTFLNCVRLFAELVYVMESEVLEILSDEYLNDYAEMDCRLVIGEAILKVCKELGPLCYKYKSVLLNCFMYGARSKLDEFRMSSYANLGHLCRILCYQVHQFFHELMNLVDCEISTGKYLPAKRAAVLVISELVQGMDNLLDFEELLLPIYRLLKAIQFDEGMDEKMRLHASNGLKAISERCTKFLLPEQKLIKDIQILGIKDKSSSKKKNQFLEII